MTTVSSPCAATSASKSPPLTDQGVFRGSLVLALLTLCGFGFLYALAGVGVGQLLFPRQANGTLVVRDGVVLGSALVAQPFVSAQYFQPRPSAVGYNPMALGGSNQARTHPELRTRLEHEREAVALREGVPPAAVPSDLVTQSGAGIDPHISVQAAAIQLVRVARARSLEPSTVQDLIAQHTQQPQLGVLGQARVHVLALNLALDALPGANSHAPRTAPEPAVSQ